MRLNKIIENLNKASFSIEITPPLKIKKIDKIFKIIDKLITYSPSFVSVTYHQQNVSEKIVNDKKELHTFQKHASNLGICSAIKYKYGLEAIPHFICGEFDKFSTEDILFDFNFLNIDNVLALRGDAPEKTNDLAINSLKNFNAADIVMQIKDMAKGKFHHEMIPESPIDFCTGVAGYPEKHSEAVSLQEDVKWLKHKVDCGAEYIITQMFFDFEKFITWEKLCRKAGINVPIIPGIKPITQKKQIRRFDKRFSVEFPESFILDMENAQGTEEAYKIGIDFTIDLSKKLIDYGFPIIHYFTMGNGNDVLDVVKNVFPKNGE